MFKIFSLFFVVISNLYCCESLGIYHENTKVIFRADKVADYFGYTVLLNDTGLFVGAPKARSRIDNSSSTGLVFICPIDNMERKFVTCRPYADSGGHVTTFVKNDMWFGAVLVMLPTSKLLICAPRQLISYSSIVYLQNGACYVTDQKKGQWLFPLQEKKRQTYKFDGIRKEYYVDDYFDVLHFYDLGQAGMSAKLTEDDTLIIGAPGLMQCTGGIAEYTVYSDFKTESLKFTMSPIINPYNVRDLGPDEYIGYSVESGNFDTTGRTLYVAGAPKSRRGYGQMKVHGPHLGSYFGASVLCVDVNGDSVVDLLVGAPNYVKKGDGLSYDQGAVFVYLTERQDTTFILKDAGSVMGSGESGARFGTTIAALGDVDGDGFPDIAIGAPWENQGLGAVYIYRGSVTGLSSIYVQKVVAEGARTFGISISKGIDVDNNNCNDLAVGAYQTETAYIFRCVPTIQVAAVINVPGAMDLPQNVTNFTALFCVVAPAKKMWPYVKIDLRAKVLVDLEENRAVISGDSEYNVSVKPGDSACEKHTIKVMPYADLSRPISIKFSLQAIELMKDDSSVFVRNAARLSDDSVLQTEFDVQLTTDCGEDLICKPLLTMILEPLANPYVPGSDKRLGFKVKIFNKEEPAYGARVYLQLPSNPKRLPSDCILEELNVTCKVPSPLRREESVLWVIEMEPTLKGVIDKELKVLARLKDYLHKNDSNFEELKITVTPMANISISSKVLPNKTIAVSRDRVSEGRNVVFYHYYEVTNYGPSDLYRLEAFIEIPDQVNLSSPIKGCLEVHNKTECIWSLPAKVSMPIIFSLRYDLGRHKDYVEENTPLNITTTIGLLLQDRQQLLSTTTTLVLDPKLPLWPVIVASLVGSSLLAVIVYTMYRYGFFSRSSREELKKLQKQSAPEDACTASGVTYTAADESTQEFVNLDSDKLL